MDVIFTFKNTNLVIKAEQVLLQKHVGVSVLPLPTQISAGCGLCLRVGYNDLEISKQAFNESSIDDFGVWEKTKQMDKTVYIPENSGGGFSLNKISLKGGMGCACKIDSARLRSILSSIPKKDDPNLLVGYDTSDDGAVYKISEEAAIIQTLDFFTPMHEDPFVFGQIAAANALSDIYSMGGEAICALNIVCFPEKEKNEVLQEILQGGASKVHEAGACLVGGHSINDDSIKYGLSVTGIVHPEKILANAGAKIGDSVILTKPLGVGIINTTNRVGEASAEAVRKALLNMTTLNKYALQILKKYNIHGCTDVTGFGLAGHGVEMASASGVTLELYKKDMHYIPEAREYAQEFLVSTAGQKNRNNYACEIDFEALSFAEAELLFDAQTSGGLLVTLPGHEAPKALEELNTLEIKSKIIGKVTQKKGKSIVFKGE